jgi:hypothetical protein
VSRAVSACHYFPLLLCEIVATEFRKGIYGASLMSSRGLRSVLRFSFGVVLCSLSLVWCVFVFLQQGHSETGHLRALAVPAEGARFSFGEKKLDEFLHGFSGSEEDGPDHWRWSDGLKSSIVVSLPPGKAFRIVLKVTPAISQDREQKLELRVDGNILDAASLGVRPIQREVEFAIPAGGSEIRELEFRYAYTVNLKRLGLSNDERELAVQFRDLAFIP